MVEANDYFLTEKELRDRFEERVKEFVFSGYMPQRQPVLVLLGAQPAAGKSQAMAAAAQRLADRQLVPLTGDDLRPFHPRHQEILETEPWLFPDATGQASGAWVRMSIAHARDHGYSLMLEGVFRDPAMTLATAEEFAALGIPVEVIGLGVRQERSRLDGLHRFLEGGRWTPSDLHDLAYRKMPETIAAAEASPAVRRITITDRTGADLYVNERTNDGQWSAEPRAVTALQASRARPLPPEEAADWMGLHQRVVVELASRGQVDATSMPVLRQVAIDGQTVAAMDRDPQSRARRDYAAARPLLQLLASGPLPSANVMPLPLISDEHLESRSRMDATRVTAEIERRRALAPLDRQAEDAIRAHLASRLRAADQSSVREAPSGSEPAPRPSSTAARSRSTTVRKPGKDRPATTGAAEQPPHLRSPRADRGRRRGPTA